MVTVVNCRLYVDGALKGQMVGNMDYVNEDGNTAQITGGNPAYLTGPIHLCSRSDNNATRHFGGRVAYLGESRLPILLAFISSLALEEAADICQASYSRSYAP